MTNYHIADFLIRLKNASMANIKELTMPTTNLIEGVAKTLKDEKFLSDVLIKDGKITVKLAIYMKRPVLTNVTMISRPGLRIYMDVDELESIKSPDIYILSTPKGVMSGKKAIKTRTGGEVIAKVI
ncbi:MAG: 30S ribosomal protein S8 [uncultured bacterium]|nr:MAG: 30S ribosomal protein S8 [uncultured bacterium]